MLDQAIEALATYDWGVDPNVLKPIDDAVVATHGDAVARQALETRLAAVLKSEASRDAKDFVCRKLMVVGTAASVPILAALLAEKDYSHMARYALERIPAPEAAQALRDACRLGPDLLVGVIASLGVRRDAASVPALTGMLASADVAVARAAALALGDIRTPEAAQALAATGAVAAEAQPAVADASFACAEALLADGKKAEALALFKSFVGDGQPKHVRLAATRGMLACAGKTE